MVIILVTSSSVTIIVMIMVINNHYQWYFDDYNNYHGSIPLLLEPGTQCASYLCAWETLPSWIFLIHRFSAFHSTPRSNNFFPV